MCQLSTLKPRPLGLFLFCKGVPRKHQPRKAPVCPRPHHWAHTPWHVQNQDLSAEVITNGPRTTPANGRATPSIPTSPSSRSAWRSRTACLPSLPPGSTRSTSSRNLAMPSWIKPVTPKKYPTVLLFEGRRKPSSKGIQNEASVP